MKILDVRPLTHNERVLALLSDGKPHSHRELYGLFVIAHSRVSDLRKRGHTISMWREGDDYMYCLEDSAPGSLLPSLPVGEVMVAATDTPSSVPGAEQLVLGTA